MNLSSFVSKNMVTVNLRSNTKRAVIAEIVGYICSRLSLPNKNDILQSVLDREGKASTGIGDGVAIPHSRLPRLEQVLFFVGVSKPGIDFGAPDGKVAHIIFLFVTPEAESQTHLKILSLIGNLQKNSTLLQKLIGASSDAELFDILNFEQVQRESYYPLSRDEVFRELETSEAGLSEYEARARLEVYGQNRLLDIGATPLVRKFLQNLGDPARLPLWAAVVLSFVAGRPVIASILILLILLTALLGFLREYKRDRAVDALRTFIPPITGVFRGGHEKRINTENLVPGDILLLDAGDVIPADGRLIETEELRVDNSAFSGDPKPVYKSHDPVKNREQFLWMEVPALVFAGTTVIAGTGKAVVTSTGMDTELGQIAYLTQTIKSQPSRLEGLVNRFARVEAFGALGVLAIAVGLLFIFNRIGGTPISIPTVLVAVIGIILGTTAEGLTPAITLVLLSAVIRLRRKGVIIKRFSSVEGIGATDVICTDKTGTLTKSEMCVKQLWLGGKIIEVGGEGYDPSGSFQEGDRTIPGIDLGNSDYRIFFYDAALCNNAVLKAPDEQHPAWYVQGDPTEGALVALAEKAEVEVETIRATYPAVRRFPFDSVRKRMSTIHHLGGTPSEKEAYYLFVKGAPHELLQLSTKVLIEGKERSIDEQMGATIDARIDQFAEQGMRVLGFGYRRLSKKELNGASVEQLEQNLVFTGVAALMDPPRPDAREAIRICREAGIRVIMITGEYQLTALSIARQLGVVATPDARVMSGKEVSECTDSELEAALESGEIVFARVNPEHRLKIVRVLEQMGKLVAATGDGISDAPVLKRADIGVAMGRRGNPVTRATAEMILSGDSFAGIVAAIAEGRAVFAGIRRMIGYLASHLLPEALSFVIFLLLSVPLPLALPLVLLIDLVIDLLPALTIGIIPLSADPMKSPTDSKALERADRRFASRDLLFHGAIVTAVAFAFFFLPLLGGETVQYRPGFDPAKSMGFFLGIIVAQLALFVSGLSRTIVSHNHGGLVAVAGLASVIWSLGIVAMAAYIPPLRAVFNTSSLLGRDWINGAVGFVIAFGLTELGNLIRRRRTASGSSRVD